jgi:hypothetical protein
MSNLERERLLSDLEFKRLMNRSLEPNIRAANDARVRRKLSAWLKNINDVFVILQKLPEDQLKEVISNEDLDKLYSIIGMEMKIKNYYPPALEQWRADLEKKETEIFKLRHEMFLVDGWHGMTSYSAPLIDLVQQGGTWTVENILKELHLDYEDSDAIKIATRQLEALSDFGLVIEVPGGWKWIGRGPEEEQNSSGEQEKSN